MKKFLLAMCLFLGVAGMCANLTAGAQSRAKAGRYDQQIRTAVESILSREARYKNVKAEVDDSVVTLTGNVELDSTRRGLVEQIRKIVHVESVENQLMLNPPAMADKELYGLVQRNLEEAGFQNLTIEVHEGAVTLQGMVADQQQRQRVIELVRRIDGVKEVDTRLSFASH